MRYFIQTSILIGLKAFIFFSAFSVVHSQSVTITGVIKNPADKPIKNALITLRNLKDEILYEETSNRKGFFKFEDIEPKFYYLVVYHEIEGSKELNSILKRVKIQM